MKIREFESPTTLEENVEENNVYAYEICGKKKFGEAWNPQAYSRKYIQNRRKNLKNCFTNFTDWSIWKNRKGICQVRHGG